MRRGLASLIMALSLVVATASWAGFVLSRTVLDPGRSERLADNLLDNEEVRATIVDKLADAVEDRIPTETPVGREVIEGAAELALEDPRVEAVVRDGIVKTHQNALNGVDEPVMLDASALGQVAREQAVAARPELNTVLPQAPNFQVELPTTGLSWIGSVKNAVNRLTRIGALIALAGMVSSFIVTKNRPAALRRVAFWSFGAAAFWIIAAYAVPAILSRVAPSSVAIATAVIDVFFGAMIRPAITLAVVGAVLLGISLAWPAVARRRPAAMVNSGPGPRPVQRQQPATGLSYSSGAGVAPAAAGYPPQTESSSPSWPTATGSNAYAVPLANHHPPAQAVSPPVENVHDWPQDPSTTRMWPGQDSFSDANPHHRGDHPDFVAEARTWSRAEDLDQGETRILGIQEPAAGRPDQPDGRWVEGVGYVEDDGPDPWNRP